MSKNTSPARSDGLGKPDSVRREALRDFLEWDVDAWSPAIRLWHQLLANLGDAEVLELGAHNGGLSLFFAMHGYRVICSDLDGPTRSAQELHQRHMVSERISYRRINATQIDCPAASVDIVCLKSVLGGIGRDNNFDAQRRVIIEAHRVLRPGGMLLFAENMDASWLHRAARRRFVRWGRHWRYLKYYELEDLFSPFSKVDFQFTGFLTAFARTERQKRLLYIVDRAILPLIPINSRYIMYGVATKANC